MCRCAQVCVRCVYECVHRHERARGWEMGETLGRWQPCARRTLLTLTALLALRDSQGVPRVAEAQIGSHAIDAATFSRTRIFQALVFICAQATNEERQSPQQPPASPMARQVGKGSAELPENLPPRSLKDRMFH